jgi:hypothetical protein
MIIFYYTKKNAVSIIQALGANYLNEMQPANNNKITQLVAKMVGTAKYQVFVFNCHHILIYDISMYQCLCRSHWKIKYQ